MIFFDGRSRCRAAEILQQARARLASDDPRSKVPFPLVLFPTFHGTCSEHVDWSRAKRTGRHGNVTGGNDNRLSVHDERTHRLAQANYFPSPVGFPHPYLLREIPSRRWKPVLRSEFCKNKEMENFHVSVRRGNAPEPRVTGRAVAFKVHPHLPWASTTKNAVMQCMPRSRKPWHLGLLRRLMAVDQALFSASGT